MTSFLSPFNSHHHPTKPIKIYGFEVSQPCRSVYMLCDEADVPFEIDNVNLLTGAQKLPAYLAVNPSGQVPAIDDDGFILAESGAILTYICNSRHLTQWYPNDVRIRARVDFWMHWHHGNTRISTQKIFGPAVFKTAEHHEDREAFRRVMHLLEDHFSKHRFLVEGTEDPTIADLLILPEIDQLSWIPGLWDMSPYPHVHRWLEIMKFRVQSYHKYADHPAERIRLLTHSP